MTVITLGCGVGIQMFGKVIDTHRSARASAVAMAAITVGTIFGAIAARTLSLPLGITSAAVMGVAYGLALVGGLPRSSASPEKMISPALRPCPIPCPIPASLSPWPLAPSHPT